MSDVLRPVSGDFGLVAKGLGLGQDGLGLYGVKEVADILEALHSVGGDDYRQERLRVLIGNIWLWILWFHNLHNTGSSLTRTR